MKDDKKLSDRLARVVDSISRGEFKLLELDISVDEGRTSVDEGTTILVRMRMSRTPKMGGPAPARRGGKGKIKKPPDIVRQLIFDDGD